MASTLCVLNFSEGTKTIYLHFMSILYTDMTQVIGILPRERLRLANIMAADDLAMQGARA